MSTVSETFAAWRTELGALMREYLGEAGEAEHRIDCRVDPARALRAIPAAAPRDAALVLSGADVLRPTVRLPHASEKILREALKYELEKLSPIPADEIYFDFAVLSRDRAANTAEIGLRVIRRDIVDDAVRLARGAGLAVSSIRFEDDEKPADPRHFPVDRAAGLRAQWRRNSLTMLGGGVLALLLALLLATYLRSAMLLDTITDAVAEEGIRAARVEQLQSRIERASAQLAFLSKQKRAPLFAAILADVTRTLPDGTWITQFDLSGSKIRIEGYSRSASDLIAVFERSGRFTNAQFAAPVTQGPTPMIDRFDLSFEIAGVPR